MADYERFRSGDPLTKITANLLNDTIEAINATKVTDPTGRPYPAPHRSSSTILVQNKSGAAVGRYNVLKLKEPTLPPKDGAGQDADDSQTNGALRVVTFDLIKPTGSDDGIWCVIQQPLAVDGIGLAVISGATWCRVNMASSSDKFVDSENNSTVAKSGEKGQKIAWVKGGVGSATTGEQWAVVLLGGGAAQSDKGQYKDQVKMMVSQNQSGWDFPKAHAM